LCGWVGPRPGVDVLKKREIFFLAGNRTLKDNITAWLLHGITWILNAGLFMIYKS
jgi:hypothetical protein